MEQGVAARDRLPAETPSLLTPRGTFVLVAAYFLLQALFRILISDSAELDESEQVLCSQAWLWGYGSDPPLYTWLQILVFKVVGTGVPGLALFKNSLLATAFGFTYLAAREITRDQRVWTVATLSVLLFPQITWESQRDLTHSVLATALSSATFFVALRLWKKPSPGWYAAVGVALGLGALSKHSYSIMALAVLLAALTLPALRARMLNRWALLTLAIFVIITAMHVRWILLSPEVAFRRTSEVIQQSNENRVLARFLGWASLIQCVFLGGGVIGFVALVCFGRPTLQWAADDSGLVQRWLTRVGFALLAVCAVIVLLSGVEFRDRWFQPVDPLAAIWVALAVRERFTGAGLRRFGRIVIAVGVVALLVLPGIPLTASVTRRPTRLNSPFSALAAELQKTGPAPSMILGGTRLVAGNLRLHFPDTIATAPESAPLPLRRRGPVLVVWDVTKKEELPERLVGFVRRITGQDIAPLASAVVEAPFKYAPARRMKLRYVWLNWGA